MTKPIVPPDLLKAIKAIDKPAVANPPASAVGLPKAKADPKQPARPSSKGKGGVKHTRMSNRGK